MYYVLYLTFNHHFPLPLLQFGGKLVSFGGSGPKVVTISQVTTETELMERSSTLEGALHEGRFAEFCASKMDAVVDSEQEKNVWNFLKVWCGSVGGWEGWGG